MTYSPKLSEAHIPYDGGWTEENGTPVLLLSVPTIPFKMNTNIHKFSYTWLFEKEMNAYVLCIRLNNQEEFGLIFSQKEAGVLLLDADAYGEFTVVITTEHLENLKDDTPFLSFPKISLTRSLLAGW
ncbi:hypothetical protein ACQCU1_12200 [Sutcliffiella horikoshii]|uniref:Uncharacterized protein n=1 Tax=Sutcliffiella horikoshii TaxID=79883 RepID=A0AA95B4X9_9BACI|nr:hypothetical protein [Sutcliffiella horikoshii]TYS55651.1 hypothetical protein FZC74_18020 [Sutcliffiella horikoshii]